MRTPHLTVRRLLSRLEPTEPLAPGRPADTKSAPCRLAAGAGGAGAPAAQAGGGEGRLRRRPRGGPLGGGARQGREAPPPGRVTEPRPGGALPRLSPGPPRGDRPPAATALSQADRAEQDPSRAAGGRRDRIA